jgi:hypothetical protein
MESMLERAKAREMRDAAPPDRELALLTVAYGTGEITLTQVGAAVDKKGNSAYAQLAKGLRDAFTLGLLVRGPATKGVKR